MEHQRSNAKYLPSRYVLKVWHKFIEFIQLYKLTRILGERLGPSIPVE